MSNQLGIFQSIIDEGPTSRYPGERPQQEATKLQVIIEARSERIEMLKQALRGVRTLRDEIALLTELTDEIAALRELREMAIFCKPSLP
jgi:hypothetical protein